MWVMLSSVRRCCWPLAPALTHQPPKRTPAWRLNHAVLFDAMARLSHFDVHAASIRYGPDLPIMTCSR